MITEKQLGGLIREYFEGSEKFLVELVIKPVNRIMVFIDGDHGVTIADCQKLSRHLEQALDRDREDFDLMVSSSGADRPLQLPRQYVKYIGRKFDIVNNNGDRFEGVLLKSGSEGITVVLEIKKSKKETERKEVAMNFSEIKSAKVVLSFKKT